MLNKRSVRVFIALVALSASASPASAYIDPGTGMTFISGIGAFVMGFIALAFGAIVMTFKRWTAAIKSLFAKK